MEDDEGERRGEGQYKTSEVVSSVFYHATGVLERLLCFYFVHTVPYSQGSFHGGSSLSFLKPLRVALFFFHDKLPHSLSHLKSSVYVKRKGDEVKSLRVCYPINFFCMHLYDSLIFHSFGL